MNPLFANNLLLILLALWTIPWKIYAIWLAVKHDHKKWFVAMLILNTIGILEIYYIFKVANKTWPEVQGTFSETFHSIKRENGRPETHHSNHHASH